MLSELLGTNGRRNRTQRVEKPPETPFFYLEYIEFDILKYRNTVSRCVTGCHAGVTLEEITGVAGSNPGAAIFNLQLH